MYSTIKPPPKLQAIAQPPKQLYLRGQLPTDRLTVSIVGSRHASSEGKQTAFEIAKRLASSGVVVVSGLAVGIDSAAHEGAISVNGQTVAVLPCGIDNVYPASHKGLAERILASGGGLISEYPGTRPPRKHDFLARNRLIAGISDLVIVVEAASRSGALNTARYAIEENISLMAVPGSIYNPLSNGCNNLIRQGALIYTDISDIFLALGIEPTAPKTHLAYSPDQQVIITSLGENTPMVEELALSLGWEVAKLQPEITKLELDGVVTRIPGNRLKLL